MRRIEKPGPGAKQILAAPWTRACAAIALDPAWQVLLSWIPACAVPLPWIPACKVLLS
jgi:hypothetical protein